MNEMHTPATYRVPTPSELAARFDRSALPGQFVLGRSREHVPAGWAVHEMRGWVLGTHAGLPVHAVCATAGAIIGWLLGFPIDANGQWIGTDISFVLGANPSPREFEDALYTFGGKFLAIFLSTNAQRVYLNCAGSLSAVFAPAHELVASTPSLVPYSRGCDDNVELLRATGVPTSKATLALGLTSRIGVERLLPNHYLDLADWSVHRHWPLTPIDNNGDPRAAVETVAGILSRHIGAITRHAPAYLPLTAGLDSRMLLACAREHLDRIQLSTLALPDRTAQVDVEIARRVARRHGLSIDIVAYDPPHAEDLDAFLWRTGSCLAEARGWHATRTYRRMRSDRPEMTGAGGELARATYWRDLGIAQHGDPDERAVATALALPHTPDIRARARAWIDALPGNHAMHIADLLYVEQRLGAWAGVLSQGHADAIPLRIFPFAHRDAFDAMLRLPVEYKLSKRFPIDVIRSRWPELCRDPFNRPPGWRHYVQRAKRRVWLVRRALALAPPA